MHKTQQHYSLKNKRGSYIAPEFLERRPYDYFIVWTSVLFIYISGSSLYSMCTGGICNLYYLPLHWQIIILLKGVKNEYRYKINKDC